VIGPDHQSTQARHSMTDGVLNSGVSVIEETFRDVNVERYSRREFREDTGIAACNRVSVDDFHATLKSIGSSKFYVMVRAPKSAPLRP
jgi:hypothetical protein